MDAATAVVYCGGYLFLVFVAVCLATGLYYIAELVEEYTKLTKKILQHTIQATVGLYVVLLAVDRLPLHCIAAGLVANFMYHRLLRSFPFMSLTSPDFLGSCAALLANHFLWMRYFYETYHSLEYILSFFLMTVWLVPFGFFISLAANESVLPHGAGGQGFGDLGASGGAGASGGRGGKGTRGSLLGMFSFLKGKRDQVLPQVLNTVQGAGLDTAAYGVGKHRTA